MMIGHPIVGSLKIFRYRHTRDHRVERHAPKVGKNACSTASQRLRDALEFVGIALHQHTSQAFAVGFV